jgi:hypothetical protein
VRLRLVAVCGEPVTDRGVDGRGVVDASDVVVVVALREDLEQLQRTALTVVGRHVLKDSRGSAVLGDDDRAAAFGGPTDEVSGAA